MPKPEIKKPVILCVDDEKMVLDSLNNQLQKKFGDKYNYEFAESAEEAIELINSLEKEGYPVIIVISDQIMPGLTGDKFLTMIHKDHPEQIKVLLTGQASLESAINAVNNANLYRYLNKPWEENDFLLTVEKGIEQYNLLEERAQQHKIFSKFIPKQLLEYLAKPIVKIEVGDYIEKEMTALVCDIGNFSFIAEIMSAKETFNFINNYLKYIEPAITNNKGLIEKFFGEDTGIVTLFDVPSDAIKAALDLQIATKKFNEDHKGQKYTPIKCSLGLDIGNIMLGIIGSEKKLQTAVISKTLIIASRLQGQSVLYNNQILLSETLAEKIKDIPEFKRLEIKPLGKIRVAGDKNEIPFLGIKS